MPALTSLVNPASAVITNSSENPVPVTDPELQTLSLSLDQITNILSMLTISMAGRLSVDINNITAGNISTLSTLSNQSQIGSLNANDQIPSLLNSLYQSGIRKQIVTS
jgi:hypothetical protein